MKQIHLLLTICFSLTLLTPGCKKGNSYYDRMKKLAEQAKANPKDRTALNKLEKYTTDSDYWNRSYAYGSLAELAIQNVGGYQAELVPFFDKLLKDPDPGFRRAGAETILSIGPAAVDQVLPSLLTIIQEGKEDDVTWFSTKAVGKLENLEKAQDSLQILFRAAITPPPEGTQDSAPQVRYYALESIVELTMKNKLNVLPQLEVLLHSSKDPYRERVANAILKLDSNNTAAKEVMDSHGGK